MLETSSAQINRPRESKNYRGTATGNVTPETITVARTYNTLHLDHPCGVPIPLRLPNWSRKSGNRKSRLSIFSVLAVSLIAFMGWEVSVSAAPILWSNPGAGDWFNAGNWNPASVPTNLDDAFIQNGGTATAIGTTVVANDIYVGLRDVGFQPAPHGVGTLNVTNADIDAAGSISVGSIDEIGRASCRERV